MIRIIIIAVLVAVDLMIIFFAPSKNSCAIFLLFDSDIFKRMR